jgi:F420-0:gamma-glutamyl ligase-like protein
VVASGAASAPPGTVAVPVPELAAEVALELHVLRRRGDDVGAAAFVACVREAATAA